MLEPFLQCITKDHEINSTTDISTYSLTSISKNEILQNKKSVFFFLELTSKKTKEIYRHYTESQNFTHPHKKGYITGLSRYASSIFPKC